MLTAPLLCRLTIGLVMLGLKGAGLIAAVLYNCYTSLAAAREFSRRYLWPYLPFLAKRPEDKFADLVGKVMLQVRKHTHSGRSRPCIRAFARMC